MIEVKMNNVIVSDAQFLFAPAALFPHTAAGEMRKGLR